ncbi:MAG: ABC transporter permease subunit [Eubacteriales bacterium]|nr:ABC transporter permease subunit [Eubacteriales bacterium]
MGKKRKRLGRYIALYLMMVPGIIYLLINNYLPMTGIVLAFKRYNFKDGIYKSPNVGLENFKFLFKTKDAWIITRNTLCYNLVFILLGTVMAIMVAILLNEVGRACIKKVYQTVILLPFLISIVIVSYLAYAFLNESTGFLNTTLLKLLGKDPVSWYTTPKYWPVILCIVYLWKSFGYNCILYYSNLVGIDRGYYEAAAIDGAGYWKQTLHITLPCLKPTIIILTLMNISKIFYSDFGLFYQVPMNQGALLDVTNTIDTYVYRGLVQSNNIGMTAAAGLYQAFMGFVLVVAANLIVRKIDKDSALF